MISIHNNFLIVVAHPDDEVLGCGGLLKKLSKLKKNIRVVIVAEGSSCRFKKNKKNEKEIAKAIMLRKKWGTEAMRDLGVKNFCFNDLGCGRLNSYPITKIAKIVEDEIRKFKPEIIITHSNNDVNMDHRVIYQSCLQATRPTTKSKRITGLISFEILSSTEWKFNKIYEPNFFVNIEKEINYKIRALKRYKSEIMKFPHPRSKDGIISLAKYRGMQSHNKFAEAFKIIRLFSK